ncbi:ABC transporter ATP-binding protein [Nocardia sp. NPDC006044]|uniref:ABC transporter ATP-binding protein n=1 Tax=Nocardia sp. NPDC006044 TaxID=3364306 RepID=UPI003687CE81
MLAIGAAIGGLTVSAVIPMVERSFMDEVVIGGHSPVLLATALIGGTIVAFGCTALRQWATAKAALAIQFHLRMELFAALPRIGGRWKSGDVLTRASSDFNAINSMIMLVPLVVGNAFYLLVAGAFMVMMSWQLSLLMAVVVPLWTLRVHRSRRQLDAATKNVQQTTSGLVHIADQTIDRILLVKVFGRERREIAGFTTAAEDALRAQSDLIRLQARLTPALDLLTGVARVGVIAVGGLFALRGQLTIGTYLAFCTYLEQTSAPVRVFTTLLSTGRRTRTSTIRVFELLDAPAEVDERSDARLPPEGAAAVEFRAVCSGETLRDFTLGLQAGEMVVVVGARPELAAELHTLLSRYRECDGGALRIGDCDIRDLALDPLRGAIGLVDTDPVLFSGSVRENIRLGRAAVTEDELHRAVSAAGVLSVIQDLPAGLESEVGENGRLLSGGQRQRVALARALVAAPPVLILDDPVSAVDPIHEKWILSRLREEVRCSTTILVTNRRTAVLTADRIAVVAEGRVVDAGTHDELTARCAAYRQLVQDSAAVEPVGDRVPYPIQLSGRHASGERSDQAESGPGPEDGLIRRLRGPLLIGLLLIALCTGLDLLLPLVVGRSIDAGIRADSCTAIILAAVAGLAIVVVRWAASVLQIRSTRSTGARASKELRIRTFTRLQRLGLDYFDRESNGSILTLLTADVDAVVGFLQTGLAIAVVQAVSLVSVATVLLLLDSQLFALTLVFLPVFAGATLVFRRVSDNAYEATRARLGIINAELRESLAGVRVLQSCGGWSAARARYRELCIDYRTAQQRAQNCAAAYFPMVVLCKNGTATTVMIAGAVAVHSGRISVGELAAFLLYIYLLFSPLLQLSQTYDSYRQAAIGARRLRQLDKIPVLPADAPDSIPTPPLRGEINLDKVSFRYPGTDRDALTEISLRIPAGRSIALVGMSGAGKSTLAKLIARLHDPTDGVIQIDGQDIKQFTVSTYRQRVGLLPQEPRLTSGTVKDAIRYGAPLAQDDQVELAARTVGADASINRLPEGYDHPVDGVQSALTAADRRLIALARAELADPDVLLLDEPADAVPSQGRTARRRRTTVLIVHELAAAARADQIVVLHQGRLAESGRHVELLARNGHYAELWRSYTS